MDRKFYAILKPLLVLGTFLGFPLPNEFGNRKRLSYGYLLLRRKKVCQLLKKWNQTGYFFPLLENNSVFRTALISMASLFTTAVVETVLFDLSVSNHQIEKGENVKFFAKYFDSTIYKLSSIESSQLNNSVLLGILYIMSKIATIATDYCDSLCVVLCSGISSRVESLNDHLRQRLYVVLENKKNSIMNGGTNLFGANFYDEIVKLRQLSDQTSNFISPLIFTSLMVNVFSGVINLNQFINVSSEFRQNQSVSVLVSITHYILRVVVVIYFTSAVYAKSEDLMGIIEEAPLSTQALLPQRESILNMVQRKPIGINFFNTFFITRNFFISILSFMFSIEIIILQTSSGTK
ncbi:unnamed protein product [Orchesella dallaii]|uniref:Gustatory receptor n=1 Tax=Orchesella dallaii TaxID=48710 RepID=A0ABP1RAI6_9HEXA